MHSVDAVGCTLWGKVEWNPACPSGLFTCRILAACPFRHLVIFNQTTCQLSVSAQSSESLSEASIPRPEMTRGNYKIKRVQGFSFSVLVHSGVWNVEMFKNMTWINRVIRLPPPPSSVVETFQFIHMFVKTSTAIIFKRLWFPLTPPM